MASPKRKVIYGFIAILLAAVAVDAIVSWPRSNMRFRAIITIVDSTPAKDPERHFADLVFIADSYTVLNEAFSLLSDEECSDEERDAARNALYTREAKHTAKTNYMALDITSKDKAAADIAVRALAQAFIRRYGELVEAETPPLRVIGEPRIVRVHKEERVPFSWVAAASLPFGCRASPIRPVVSVLLGIPVGIWLGGRLKHRRIIYAGLTIITVIALSVGYLLHYMWTRPHTHSVSSVVADVRMLKGASDDHQIADMIRIARSQAVTDDAMEILEHAKVRGAKKILSTLRAERIGNSDLVRITVEAGNDEDAGRAAEVGAAAFILKWEALGRGAGMMRTVQPQERAQVNDTLTLAAVFLIGLLILLILTGMEIGYILGRRLGYRPAAGQEEGSTSPDV
ncbi:MAG TPA: hypothetical protein VFI02_18240 [Armatimonadota bacterium]|nr:hypothetical protein [Armatimonadota bacterium]